MKSKIKGNVHFSHLKRLSNQHSWSKREGYNVKNKQELYIEEKNVIQGYIKEETTSQMSDKGYKKVGKKWEDSLNG